MPKKLAWPPNKYDLKRLYLIEELSAAKIAEVYELKYKNPKVAESTVLHQLKRNGIERRDRAEHIRKVTDAMVDDWVRKYEAGESLKVIADTNVVPVTVWNHLKARGLILRDKVEAQIKAVTKYERKPFSGDNLEKAYLMGLRYGDLYAVKHGRAIRLRVSTTHPAMADLFETLFESFSHLARYPRVAKLVGFEWTLECDLDSSFEFLLNKATRAEIESLTESEFLSFLAGVFDAEGSIQLHKKARWYAPEACISNSDAVLLEVLGKRISELSFHYSLDWRNQRPERGGVSGKSLMGRIAILRFRDVQRFVQVVPIKHSEKTKRGELALALEFKDTRKRIEVAAKWRELSRQIREDVTQFVSSARNEIGSKS